MQGAGAGGSGDSELVSRQLQLEQKLYYLDLKDNARGRFLKISERTTNSRSTIIVPLNGVVWFVDLFNYYANGDEAELSSKELQLETKVFYFDVGENPRGRYLKVSEAQVPRSGFNRSSIIVPAGQSRDEGWAAFRNVLVEIHEASLALPPHPAQAAPSMQASTGLPSTATSSAPMAPTSAAAPAAAPPAPTISQVTAQVAGLAVGAASAGNGTPSAGTVGQPGSATASKVIRAEQKKIYLDLGSNNRGHFVKISEVQGTVRSAIIMPASAIEELYEGIGQFIEILRKQGALQSQGSHVHVRSIPSLPNKSADGEAVGN